MKLKQKGRFYELPIIGLSINRIVFDGLITLVFNDQEQSYLDLHSIFKVIQYNQTINLNPKEKEGLTFFYDQYGKNINDAKADSKGNLWITFENGIEIIVEDGPTENWHYTKINLTNPMNSLKVHGGVGQTTF